MITVQNKEVNNFKKACYTPDYFKDEGWHTVFKNYIAYEVMAIRNDKDEIVIDKTTLRKAKYKKVVNKKLHHEDLITMYRDRLMHGIITKLGEYAKEKKDATLLIQQLRLAQTLPDPRSIKAMNKKIVHKPKESEDKHWYLQKYYNNFKHKIGKPIVLPTIMNEERMRESFKYLLDIRSYMYPSTHIYTTLHSGDGTPLRYTSTQLSF